MHVQVFADKFKLRCSNMYMRRWESLEVDKTISATNHLKHKVPTESKKLNKTSNKIMSNIQSKEMESGEQKIRIANRLAVDEIGCEICKRRWRSQHTPSLFYGVSRRETDAGENKAAPQSIHCAVDRKLKYAVCISCSHVSPPLKGYLRMTHGKSTNYNIKINY